MQAEMNRKSRGKFDLLQSVYSHGAGSVIFNSCFSVDVDNPSVSLVSAVKGRTLCSGVFFNFLNDVTLFSDTKKI